MAAAVDTPGSELGNNDGRLRFEQMSSLPAIFAMGLWIMAQSTLGEIAGDVETIDSMM